MIEISLQPEYVLNFFGLLVTNTFFTSILVSLILCLWGVFFYFFKDKKESEHFFLKLWHILVYELLKLSDTITKDRELAKRLLPLIATLFIFIIFTNLIALLPGFLGSFYLDSNGINVSLFRSASSDLTTTLALSIITVISIQYFSMSYLGFFGYIKRFINFSGILPFILGFFEALSEITRVLSFSFRLFGNVFAGEVLLLVIAFLVPFVIPVPFMVLEVFVSLIQAYIFSVLALTYIRLSTQKSL